MAGNVQKPEAGDLDYLRGQQQGDGMDFETEVVTGIRHNSDKTVAVMRRLVFKKGLLVSVGSERQETIAEIASFS